MALVDALVETLRIAVERDGLPGIGLSIVRGGERTDVIEGVADQSGTPLTADSIGRYHSSAKAVTSVVVLQLVEAGVLSLDTAISQIVPEWAEVAPSPTVHHLLTHTAGLTYEVSHRQAVSLETFSQQLVAAGLSYQPGASWLYSVSHDLLGRVVEVVAGRSIAELASQGVFSPLGMSRSSFTLAGLPDAPGDCWMHRPGQDPAIEPAEVPVDEHEQMLSAGGGLFSTLNDYTAFCEALLHGSPTLIGSDLLNLMLTDHLGGIGGLDPDFGFGFGGLVTKIGSKPWPPGVFSWGGYAGTQFLIDRANDLAVCLHLQVQHDFTLTVWSEILDVIYDG